MRKRYVDTSRGLIATFELIGDQLTASPGSDDLLTSLRRELHRVTGTAGSLGFLGAGRMAGAMESLARRWSAEPSMDCDRRGSIVSRFARSLARAIATGDEAHDGGLRRLLLVGLPDAVADPLVAEGIELGLAVERLQALGDVQLDAPAWGVITMDASPALAALALQTPCVLLASGGEPLPGQSPDAQTLDVAMHPSQILGTLEGIARRDGGAAGTVLLVDDDPMMLLLMRALAEHEGMTVETAATAAAFRETLARIEPMVVVFDVELPDADGVALLRELRADGRHGDVPVLMLSSRADGETRAAAFDAGADDYMVKPLVHAEFQRRMRHLLESRRALRLSTGLDPVTGLTVLARTMKELDGRIGARGDAEWSVALVRPCTPPLDDAGTAAWAAECVRIARAAHSAGGFAGLVDPPCLVVALPLAPPEAAERLGAIAAEAANGEPRWNCGVAGTSAIALAAPRALVSAAWDACLVARDEQVLARIWSPADADIAPDVIIVEDDDALAEMMAFTLDAKGLTHRRYANGPDALAALLRVQVRDRSPIILLDVDLPGMDGHSLHERLRLERPGAFHVVFVSLHTSEVDQLRALQGGALDYLPKPISLRVLMAKLAVWRERTRRG